MALIVSLYFDEYFDDFEENEIDLDRVEYLIASIEEPREHLMRWEIVKMPWEKNGEDDA